MLLPEEVGDLERQLDEPDDREAEHAEEHPRADPARRGLAHEALSSERVEDERAHRRQLREEEAQAQEALEAARPGERVRGEEAVRVDARQVQVARHVGAVPEEVRRGGPDAGEHR